MPKLQSYLYLHGGVAGYIFWCPACEQAHAVPTDDAAVPIHEFNGDLERPTFTPSIRFSRSKWPEADTEYHLCHSLITDGRIHFEDDSTHQMAGRTVKLPDWTGQWS